VTPPYVTDVILSVAEIVVTKTMTPRGVPVAACDQENEAAEVEPVVPV
jgi:hypothetical protein